MPKLSDADLYKLKSNFSKRLLKYRLDRGLSQENMAEKTGISQYVFSFYENGERRPSFVNIMKMCVGMGVTPNQLLGYEE